MRVSAGLLDEYTGYDIILLWLRVLPQRFR